ncbi:hypothetical protein AYI69_g4446 [Smittium culicis]|uniref:FANCL UBC-like domain-containing protein n=1 Tax=Smittium culicis TaxID=133412 RepID=A0A1R1YDL7_9FUNG|nr:hypothetical protein AYI69_g4446 [Smittium culicis]
MFYSKLVPELEKIGWSKVSHFDHKTMYLEVSLGKSENRNFSILIELKEASVILKSPLIPTTKTLIAELRVDWLTSYYEDMNSICDKYCLAWEFLDEIDENCLVVYPKASSKSTVYSNPLVFERRIAIAELISISFSISPISPNIYPLSIIVNGPTLKTSKIKQSILQNRSACALNSR